MPNTSMATCHVARAMKISPAPNHLWCGTAVRATSLGSSCSAFSPGSMRFLPPVGSKLAPARKLGKEWGLDAGDCFWSPTGHLS